MRINAIAKTLAGVLAAAVALAAPPGHARSAAAVAKTAAAGTAAARISRADQKIVMDLAQANMAEIEAAKIALGTSQNQQVKTFARQMIDDHDKALLAVRQLASAKGLVLPAELDKKHKAMAEQLGASSGDAFDKAYMAQYGVAEHRKMHAMLAAAETKARDPEVKALVANIAPTVEQHLKSARRMGVTRGAAEGEKSPAGTAAGK